MRSRIPAVLLMYAGCASVPLTVTPIQGATPAPAKDKNCVVEFWAGEGRRAFDELAEVKVSGPVVRSEGISRHEAVLEAMRQEACALGADAIIGLHEAAGGGERPVEIGTAVRYRTQ